MLELNIEKKDLWDETNNEFLLLDAFTLKLEHSLLSLTKWESKWKKPFLSDAPKTYEETIDYIRCMTISQNIPDYYYNAIGSEELTKIKEYISDPMTATTIKETPGKGSNEIWTSELIYYTMIEFGIPMECEKWHLNRLLTLIRVCSIKNSPSKKMTKSEILIKNSELNAKRRAQLNSRG